ncbi:MAG: citrulline utilization hydrolase CtlX [Chitinophagaceae bacterium]
MQTTSHILMIRPVSFVYNEQTAVNNAFQSVTGDTSRVQEKALAEFDSFVAVLRNNGIDVTVSQDTADPHTPDSVFPNNWVSFHSNGTVVLYPMFAPNRRAERKPHVLDIVSEKFQSGQVIDLTGFENSDLFLEGTGSMVLDRDRQIAYACLSPRTNEQILKEFCEKMNYTPVVFTATDGNGQDIYHTNVMMCVADRYVVICLESIPSPTEQQVVSDTILRSGKELIPISLKQMNHFAGNMLQVENGEGEKLLVMSTQAYESLSDEQVTKLNSFNRIVHSPINTIETNGGGSARCMMAEVFLKVK